MHERKYFCCVRFIPHIQRGKADSITLVLGKELLPPLHMALVHMIYIHDQHRYIVTQAYRTVPRRYQKGRTADSILDVLDEESRLWIMFRHKHHTSFAEIHAHPPYDLAPTTYFSVASALAEGSMGHPLNFVNICHRTSFVVTSRTTKLVLQENTSNRSEEHTSELQ